MGIEQLSKQTRALCRQLEGCGWNVVFDIHRGMYYLAPDGPDGWPDESYGRDGTRYFKTIPEAARHGLAAMAASA